MELLKRPRRLRGSELVRRMVRETRMDAASLIYPMFVMDGVNRVDEISSLPGQYRYTVDRMEEELIRSAAFYRLGCNMEIEAAETAWRGMNPGKPLPFPGIPAYQPCRVQKARNKTIQ